MSRNPYDEEYEEEFWDEPGEGDGSFREDFSDDFYDSFPDDSPKETYEEDYENDFGEQADRRNSAGRRGARGRGHRHSRGGGIFLKVLIAVLAVVFVAAAYQVVSTLLTYQTAIDEYDALSTYIEAIPDTQEEVTLLVEEEEETLRYPALSIDFEALREINSEFVGVIHIPVLELTYPVAQAQDNVKYLTTTFEGTTNSSGCIFLDQYASSDFSDANTFLFGHNMKNQTMFGSLKLFLQDEELCDEDPYIYLYQEDRVLIYRIFAYYTIPVDDDVYEDFYGEDGYDAYVQDALSHSNYALEDGAVDWTKRPNLLTLSTCYATGHTHNFVVQAAQVGIAE